MKFTRTSTEAADAKRLLGRMYKGVFVVAIIWAGYGLTHSYTGIIGAIIALLFLEGRRNMKRATR